MVLVFTSSVFMVFVCVSQISYTHELLLFLQGSNFPASRKAHQGTSHLCDAWGVGRGLGPLNKLGILLEASSLTGWSEQGKIRVWSDCSRPCPATFWKSENAKIVLHLWAPAAGLNDLLRISLAAACLSTFHWAPLKTGWLLFLPNVHWVLQAAAGYPLILLQARQTQCL